MKGHNVSYHTIMDDQVGGVKIVQTIKFHVIPVAFSHSLNSRRDSHRERKK